MLTDREIRIAIIDDDEDDFLIISDYIRGINPTKFTIDWYKDYSSAMEQIRGKSYHLYFVDYFLGNRTGLDLLKDAAAINFDRPIVLLTGFGNRSIDVSAMLNGATDYLVKSDLTTEKLERCIRYSLERSNFLQELKARETKYRTLFEGSKDAVFIADTELAFSEVNDAANILLQPKNGNLSGSTLYDFVDDMVQKARIRDLVKTSGSINDLEIIIRNNEKGVRNCLLSLNVIQNANLLPVIHGIIHDITDIKKAELANLQAEKLAANERLIRMLAHEIRNPLNNIVLSAEHLVEEQDNQNRSFVEIIQRNSKRINQIISELLGMATHSELLFDKHSLQEIMDESLDLAADRINLHKIDLEKNYPSSPLLVDADKNKLVIAFTNILINAVEAMECQKGKLFILVEALPEKYLVSIKDNGCGIPQESLSKLFDPFYTSKKNGMGLGLTATYSIIQSHKARIQVESCINKGTHFQISFDKN